MKLIKKKDWWKPLISLLANEICPNIETETSSRFPFKVFISRLTVYKGRNGLEKTKQANKWALDEVMRHIHHCNSLGRSSRSLSANVRRQRHRLCVREEGRGRGRSRPLGGGGGALAHSLFELDSRRWISGAEPKGLELVP